MSVLTSTNYMCYLDEEKIPEAYNVVKENEEVGRW